MRAKLLCIAAVLGLAPMPALAQTVAQTAENPPPEIPAQEADALPTTDIISGDYLIVGLGAIFMPSYEGSDDLVVSPLPLVQGSIAGIGINPRAGGLALNLIKSRTSGKVGLSFGPAARLRMSRNGNARDEVVKLLPDLSTAIELGPSIGASASGVLNPYDIVAATADVRWDIAGAHKGMTISPALSYTTPLSRGIAAVASLNAEYANDNFMDYYFTVSPEATALTGLPTYKASGGWKSAGAQLLLGFDLNGNLQDGGFALFVIGGYSRMLGDAAKTPFTSIRGSADQWVGGGGIAYTF